MPVAPRMLNRPDEEQRPLNRAAAAGPAAIQPSPSMTPMDRRTRGGAAGHAAQYRGEEAPDTYNDLVEMLMIADEQGDDEALMIIGDMIENRQYKESQNDLVSAGMGFSQGATLGFGDELSSAIRAGTEQLLDPYIFATEQKLRGLFGDKDQPQMWKDKSFGELVDERYAQFWEGKDYMDRYKQALGTSRGMLETARREDPYITGGAELLGAAGVTAAPAAHMLRGAQTGLGGFGRLTGMGAAEGGLSGYGHSEASPIQAYAEMEEGDEYDWQEMQRAAVDTGIGVSIGGGLSATLPIGAQIGRSLLRKITSPFTKQAKLRETARREVQDLINEDLANNNITLEQAKRELADTPGMVAADLGPAMRELTETAVSRPTEGARQLADFLQTRNVDQWKRVHPKLAGAITGKDQDLFSKAVREQTEQMKQRANRLYSAVENDEVRLTPAMLQTMRDPEFKTAFETANRLRRLDQMEPIDLKQMKLGDTLTVKELDQIMQGMDDVVGQLYKDAPAVAKRVKAMRNDFRDNHLYREAPGLQRARNAWSSDKLNEEAIDKGLRIFREDADITADMLRDMGPSEKHFFKIGALRAIMRKLGNKSDTSDITKGLFDSPNKRDAIQAAFGSRDKFNEFMDYIEREQKMFLTYSQALGNSRTAKRIAQQQVAEGGGLAYALGYLGTMQLAPQMPMGLAGALSRRGYEAIASPSKAQIAAMQQQSRNLADMLTSRDLDALMRPQTIGGLLETGIPITGAAGTTGLLGTDIYPE